MMADSKALTPAALQQAGRWEALAAVAWSEAQQEQHGRGRPSRDALQRLAASADSEQAFEYLWVLLAAVGDDLPAQLGAQLRMAVAQNLSDAVQASSATRREVLDYITQPDADSDEGSVMLRAEMLSRLVLPRDELRGVARLIVSPVREQPAPWAVRERAVAILAADAVPADQALLISVVPQGARERLSMLRLVHPERRTPQLVQALVESIASQPLDRGQSQNLELLVSTTVTELPREAVLQLLSAPWARGSHKDALGRLRLGVGLSVPVLAAAVTQEETPRDLRNLLYEQARSRPTNDMFEWATWLYEHNNSEAQELTRHLVERRDRSLRRRGGSADDIEAVLTGLAVARVDATLAARAVHFLATDSVLEAIHTALPGVPGQQVGHLLGAAARKSDADIPAIANAVRGLGDDAADALPSLIEALPAEVPEELRLAICQRAAEDGSASEAVLATDLKSAFVSYLDDQGPVVVLDALVESQARLDPEDLNRLRNSLHWTRTTTEQFERTTRLVRAQSEEALVEMAAEALVSLDGPEAEAAPAAAVAGLLNHITQSQLHQQLHAAAPSGLRAVFAGHLPTHVHTAGCSWGKGLEPTEETVADIVAAHENIVGLDDAFGDVRRHHAAMLLETASDPDLPSAARSERLHLAARADSGQAASVALDLVQEGKAHIELQLAAVDVLEAGVLDGAVVPVLEDAASRAKHSELLSRLQQLLRRVQSGDHGQALANLFDLVGVEAEPDLSIYLAVEGLRDGFRAAVDRVRRDWRSTPDSLIVHATSLADLLLDIAVVSATEAGQGIVKQHEADALSRNLANRPAAGAIADRQHVQQSLPWAVLLAGLHQRRPGHALPAGQLTPHAHADPDLVWAQRQVALIVDGWVTTMNDLAAQPKE